MRVLFWFLLLAIAAVVAALAAKLNNGYALLVAPPYRTELSLNLLIILIVGSFVSLYLGLRIIVHTVRLPSQVREWRQPIAASAAAPFRLCFRLDEPPEEEKPQPWHVRYLLQSRDDPSLQVPAADVWAGTASRAAGRAALKPLLLAGLGRSRWSVASHRRLCGYSSL